jgi:hypothetical protein
VQDESLIEEMRAALKGDRERAQARRRSPRSHAGEVPPALSSEPVGEPRATFLARLGLRRKRS